METGTKVIHISERDTQISSDPKKPGEFVNTWSVDGFHEEGVAPAELGWGTHEDWLPEHGFTHTGGPENQIGIAKPGIDTLVRSWVPTTGPIIGMVVRHGEAFTISDALTVGRDGEAVYRPTVHYAYLPTDVAMASLHECRMSGYELQDAKRIMTDDITEGMDELGVLLLGHDLNGWWVGSQLDIDEARELVPHQNATTFQVAASILGAIFWMIEHPDRGLCVPDDLDHEAVLAVAAPYLGPCPSVQTDWRPSARRPRPAGRLPHAHEPDPLVLRRVPRPLTSRRTGRPARHSANGRRRVESDATAPASEDGGGYVGVAGLWWPHREVDGLPGRVAHRVHEHGQHDRGATEGEDHRQHRDVW